MGDWPEERGAFDAETGNWRLWVPALFDTDEMTRAVAADVLGACGDAEAIRPLLAALESTRGMIAGGGVVARALVRLRDAWTVEVFAEALHDRRPYVRRAAAEALGWLQDIRSFDVLIAALRDSFFGVRLEASWALGELGDPRALAPLVERLQDEDENVRRNAIEALVRLGDPRAAPALRAALEDQDPGVRAAAEDALTRLPPEAA